MNEQNAGTQDVKLAKKPTLTQESLRNQMQAANTEAQQSYDKYQQALGIVRYCQHALQTFELPENEVTTLGEVK